MDVGLRGGGVIGEGCEGGGGGGGREEGTTPIDWLEVRAACWCNGWLSDGKGR